MAGQESEVPDIQQRKVLDPSTAETVKAELVIAPKEAPKVEKGAPPSGSFDVSIPMQGHATLGLEIEETSPAGPMIKEVKPGAVSDFNKLNPTMSIKPFDVVSGLGETKDVAVIAKKLHGEHGEGEAVSITPSRPRQLQISLTKTSSLGVKLDFSTYSTGAVVREIIPSGLVAAWNSEHPKDSLCAGDRIIEINGLAQAGEQLVESMKQEKELLLTVLKYA